MAENQTNQYEPRDWPEHFNEREKKIATAAYKAGREYEASLFADVIHTITQELKRYRERAKE